ncbi:hypothetical protein GCM10028796_03650 [Ramlibacter monticola]
MPDVRRERGEQTVAAGIVGVLHGGTGFVRYRTEGCTPTAQENIRRLGCVDGRQRTVNTLPGPTPGLQADTVPPCSRARRDPVERRMRAHGRAVPRLYISVCPVTYGEQCPVPYRRGIGGVGPFAHRVFHCFPDPDGSRSVPTVA